MQPSLGLFLLWIEHLPIGNEFPFNLFDFINQDRDIRVLEPYHVALAAPGPGLLVEISQIGLIQPEFFREVDFAEALGVIGWE